MTKRITITRNGTYISSTNQEIFKQLNKAFTITVRKRIGARDIVSYNTNFYKINSNQYLYPRFGVWDLIKKGKLTINQGDEVYNEIKSYTPDHPAYKSLIALKDYQSLIVDKICKDIFSDKFIALGQAGAIIKADTGSGKTFITGKLIELMAVPTLIIVHNQPQLFDWVGFLTQNFPNLKVGCYCSKKKIYSSQVMVMVVNSALSETFKFSSNVMTNKELMEQFGFIVFDESHKYCSETFRKVFTRQATYMLGLSATPEHLEGIGDIAVWNIGPILDVTKLEGFEKKDEKFEGVLTFINYSGPPLYTMPQLNPNTQQIDHMGNIKQLAHDPYRNIMLAYLINYMIRLGKNIYVFGELTQHLWILQGLTRVYKKAMNGDQAALAYLQSYINKVNQSPEFDKDFNNSIIAEMDDEKDNSLAICLDDKDFDAITKVSTGTGRDAGKENLEYVSQHAQVIFTTYAYMGTGKSIPRMDAIIFSTPKKNRVEQYLGRIFRPGLNKNKRSVLDIVDVKSTVKKQRKSREDVYNAQEEKNRFFEITNQSISWEMFSLNEN
jgi:superfamily II DNA or RNA helicase